MFSPRFLLTLVAVLPFGPAALAARLPAEQQPPTTSSTYAVMPTNPLIQIRVAQTGQPPAVQNEDQDQPPAAQDEDQDQNQDNSDSDYQDQDQGSTDKD